MAEDLKNEVLERLHLCIRPSARPRLHTWALVNTAIEVLYPRRGNFKPQPDLANILLWKVDALLGPCNDMDKIDKIIAEDFGGEDVLSAIRAKIRLCRKLISHGHLIDAKHLLYTIDVDLFNNAILRITECLLGLRIPGSGVSV